MSIKKGMLAWIISSLIFAVVIIFLVSFKVNINYTKEIGQVVDSFNGVNVYFNGAIGHVSGRNLAKDSYNLGLKHQCVEFVKRYYYEHLQHKMPNTYGHAKDFFDVTVPSGALNLQRDLLQFSNGTVKPVVNDILVINRSLLNPYGHVAIVSQVNEDQFEIIQQNPGPFGKSREVIDLKKVDQGWFIDKPNVLGLLRLP
ncbi:CHAP domain-containing protein [Entomomonas moraniae]|nr:CHAP domain-containing protein [Entomomonas moraniae]